MNLVRHSGFPQRVYCLLLISSDFMSLFFFPIAKYLLIHLSATLLSWSSAQLCLHFFTGPPLFVIFDYFKVFSNLGSVHD